MFIQAGPQVAGDGISDGSVLKLGQLLGEVMGFGMFDLQHVPIPPSRSRLSTLDPQVSLSLRWARRRNLLLVNTSFLRPEPVD